VKPTRAPGTNETGPQVIVDGGPTVQCALPSFDVVPPTNDPLGATTMKDCQTVVPVFVRTKSYVAPRDVYVAEPPSPALAAGAVTSSRTMARRAILTAT
jgi:hypothetical protein